MSTNIQPYQGTQSLSRQDRRLLDRMDRSHAIDLVVEEYRQNLTQTRIHNGAVLTAQVGITGLGLSRVQQDMAECNPLGAARFGHAIDQFVFNGAAITGDYMRGR